MKKHLIAAAVAAAVAVPAMAQVTISGVLDVRALGSGKTTQTTSAGAVTNVKTSNTGGENTAAATVAQDGWSVSQMVFSGSEDLGGGLKASFYFAQRLNSAFETRDRYLDLAGDFGSVRVGRFNNILDSGGLIQGYGTTMTAGSTNGFYTANSNLFTATPAAGAHDRQSGMVQYTTPTINGFNGILGYAKNSSDSDATLLISGKAQTEQKYFGVTYNQGPISVVAATSDRKLSVENPASPTTALATNKSDFDLIGGRYNFGIAQVHVGHMKRKDSSSTIAGARTNLIDASINTLGVTVPMGPWTLRASMYDGDDDQGTGTADNRSLKGHQLSATYSLSKRTLIYLATGENKAQADTLGTSASGGATTSSRKFTSTNFGISHSF